MQLVYMYNCFFFLLIYVHSVLSDQVRFLIGGDHIYIYIYIYICILYFYCIDVYVSMYICVHMYNWIHHHHLSRWAWTSWTLFCHPSLWSIAPKKFSWQHQVSAQMLLYIILRWFANTVPYMFGYPFENITYYLVLFQLCTACFILLTRMVCEMVGRRLCSWRYMGCYF